MTFGDMALEIYPIFSDSITIMSQLQVFLFVDIEFAESSFLPSFIREFEVINKL